MVMEFNTYKKQSDYSYSIGAYPTIELLKYKKDKVLKIFISSKGSQNKGVEKIQEICSKESIQIEVNDKLMNKYRCREYLCGWSIPKV